jgi:ABC-type multidrug transport system ATPase subunit
MQTFSLATSGLTRHFGQLTAVDGLGLEVPRNSIYGFLGPNGAGKTTTIRLLLGLLQPHAGEVRLFGELLRGQRRSLLGRLGALVESPSLYPNLTGRENLEVTLRLIGGSRDQVDRALQTVRLEEAADRRVGGYSSGMRQRLGVALALLGEPELLILDEPTNGLDPAGMKDMRLLLRRLPEAYGLTVFLSSHLLAEVEQVATHIGIIQAGRLRFQGTLDDLQAQVREQVVVGVDQPELAVQHLQQAGWAVHSNGGHRLAIAANGRSDAALINAQLVARGLNVCRLELERPTLEDIFMTMTNDGKGGL